MRKPNTILVPTFRPNKGFWRLPIDFRIKPKQTFEHGSYRPFTIWSQSEPTFLSTSLASKNCSFPAHSCSVTSWLCACCFLAWDMLSTRLHTRLSVGASPLSAQTLVQGPLPYLPKLHILYFPMLPLSYLRLNFLLLVSCLFSQLDCKFWEVTGCLCLSNTVLSVPRAWSLDVWFYYMRTQKKCYFLSKWINSYCNNDYHGLSANYVPMSMLHTLYALCHLTVTVVPLVPVIRIITPIYRWETKSYRGY